MARELKLAPAESGQAVLKVTCPSPEVAERLASVLIELRLAACVNILPGVTSVYLWEGRVCRDTEVLLFVKTALEKGSEVLKVLEREHPYEVPEAIWTSVVQGSQSYLDWMTETMNSREEV